MRFWIDDESDDEEEVEYTVSFTPIEPTRARALATPWKNGNDCMELNMGHIARMMMEPTGRTGYDKSKKDDPKILFATTICNNFTRDKYFDPRVVEMAVPPPVKIEPVVKAPRVVRKRHYLVLNGREVKRRKVEQPWSPIVQVTNLRDNPTANAPVQVIPIDLTRGRALPEPVRLHDNPISKCNDKGIRSPRVYFHREHIRKELVQYGRDQRNYDNFILFKAEIINKGDEVLVEIKHRLRRWIANVKMKQCKIAENEVYQGN